MWPQRLSRKRGLTPTCVRRLGSLVNFHLYATRKCIAIDLLEFARARALLRLICFAIRLQTDEGSTL